MRLYIIGLEPARQDQERLRLAILALGLPETLLPEEMSPLPHKH